MNDPMLGERHLDRFLGNPASLRIVHELSLNNPVSPIQQLDVLTMLGFVILIGIVVNNGILVVHQALNNRRDYGMDWPEAIKALLSQVEIESLSKTLREAMKTETSQQKKLKFAKRLKVVEAFRRSGNLPALQTVLADAQRQGVDGARLDIS